MVEEEVDGFHGLHGADHAHQRGDYALHFAGGAFDVFVRVEALIAGAVGAARVEGGYLAFPTNGGGGDQRGAGLQGNPIHFESAGEIVGTVHHEVDGGGAFEEIVVIQRLIQCANPHRRIQGAQGVGRRFGLEFADVAVAVDDLSLQVGLVHAVEVGQRQPPDSGGGQIHRRRRTEAAESDDQHAGFEQFPLTGLADPRKANLPAVSFSVVGFRHVLAYYATLKVSTPPARSPDKWAII